MLTLCKLFGVSEQHYVLRGVTIQGREVDFHLVSPVKEQPYYCEVKLMGKGNPESADVVIARDSDVFVADKLSVLNKEQLTNLEIHWVELRNRDGYRKFFDILNKLAIPATDFTGDLDEVLPSIFEELFPLEAIPSLEETLDEADYDESEGDIE